MQIEAMYEDGKLVFNRPVQFVHSRFRVRVEVPDREVELVGPDESGHLPMQASGQPGPPPAGESSSAEASRWLARLDALRAEAIAAPQRPPSALDEAQSDRLAAFAMREDR